MKIRATMNLDRALVELAARTTGIEERTSLVHAGLQALVTREASRRLATLGGSDPAARPPRRRRNSTR